MSKTDSQSPLVASLRNHVGSHVTFGDGSELSEQHIAGMAGDMEAVLRAQKSRQNQR